MSLFISFEGGERSGKSTQTRLLADWLVSAGYTVVLVREPGSTPVGQRLRRLVKGIAMSPMAELLLFGAARAELVETVIRPHLAQGHVVVADRYADSTIAYQHYGRQLPSETVTAVVHLATDGLTPDLTFLLDLRKARHLLAPSARRRSRPGQSQLALDQDARRPELDDGGQMRFERESAKFHERVRAGYRAMALKEPARWRVLDATLPIEDIHVLVHSHLQQSLSAVPNSATPTLLDLTNLPNL